MAVHAIKTIAGVDRETCSITDPAPAPFAVHPFVAGHGLRRPRRRRQVKRLARRALVKSLRVLGRSFLRFSQCRVTYFVLARRIARAFAVAHDAAAFVSRRVARARMLRTSSRGPPKRHGPPHVLQNDCPYCCAIRYALWRSLRASARISRFVICFCFVFIAPYLSDCRLRRSASPLFSD